MPRLPVSLCAWMVLLVLIPPWLAAETARPAVPATPTVSPSATSVSSGRPVLTPPVSAAPPPGTASFATPIGPAAMATAAEAWSRLLTGTWEHRAVDKAARQVDITTLHFLPGGEYQTFRQYGPFKAEALSRGRLRITQATANEADLQMTPADQDPERLSEESTLKTRVLRLDANRLRAADGSELLRRP